MSRQQTITGSLSSEPGADRAGRLVSIVLTTYNERENILEAIGSISRHVLRPFEIVVVDDDSPDGTWELVAEQNLPEVKLIRRIATRGLASAFMRGILESQGEIVGWMDADMSTPPSLLPHMIERLRDFDVVIGSRFVAGGADERQWLRRYSSILINRFAKLVLGYGIRDYDSGFVVARRSVFDQVSFAPTGHGEYFIEFIYACCRKGLKVCEVPYAFRDRAQGTSKSIPSLWTFLRLGLGYVIRIVWIRFRRMK